MQEIHSQQLAFDWTVNLGQIGIILSFVFAIGGWAAIQRMSMRALATDIGKVAIDLLALAAKFETYQERVAEKNEKRDDNLDTKFAQISTALTEVAKQNLRLDSHEKRLDSFDRRQAQLTDEISALRQSTVLISPVGKRVGAPFGDQA